MQNNKNMKLQLSFQSINGCKQLTIVNSTTNNNSNEINIDKKTFHLEISPQQSPLTINFGINFEQITSMKLPHCNLSYIPQELCCYNLIELDISKNNFKYVPNLVYYNPKLKHLNVSHNLLQDFSVEPKCSATLHHLDISHNYLEIIPMWIFSIFCDELEILKLNKNPFKPCYDARTLFKGRYLKKLSVLEMNNSNLKNNLIPKFISEVPKLKKLYLSNTDIKNEYLNSIQDLPFHTFACISYLVELHFSGIGIPVIPDNIILLTSLEVLNISHNYISWLPDNFINLQKLQILDISHNNLLILPKNINELKYLKELYISNNSLGSLPQSILELVYLEVLDCYNNEFFEDILELIEKLPSITAIDLENNLFETPEDKLYTEKREKLRKNIFNRINGGKILDNNSNDGSESRFGSEDYDDGNVIESFQALKNDQEPENWDKDSEYSIQDDMDLTLRPFILKRLKKSKTYDPTELMDPVYFEDAEYDPTPHTFY